MKIAKIESHHADAGTRNFDFLKLTTDTGLVGWSEHNEATVRAHPPRQR
jgi:L-alanine-DL-glutamate epimerase-like enolase superfamily enzyme